LLKKPVGREILLCSDNIDDFSFYAFIGRPFVLKHVQTFVEKINWLSGRANPPVK
jgi:hypothetical protein